MARVRKDLNINRKDVKRLNNPYDSKRRLQDSVEALTGELH
jgi:hypothetical protein